MKNQIKLPLLALFTLFLFQCSNNDDAPMEQQIEPETVIDADGNVYQTIQIGNQTWMLENLKTTKYNDGTPITPYTFAEHGINWGSFNNQEAFYRWADTNDLNNVVDEELAFDAYGAMYNHWAVETGKLAPTGWKIPSEADFRELEAFLTNDGNAGNEATVLKSTSGWLPSAGNGTNLYNLNFLPNGYVAAQGTATFANGSATLTTTDGNFEGALGLQSRVLFQLNENGPIVFADNVLQLSAGIRCIKIQ